MRDTLISVSVHACMHVCSSIYIYITVTCNYIPIVTVSNGALGSIHLFWEIIPVALDININIDVCILHIISTVW